MTRDDIFAIEFPNNEQVRSYLNIKKLNDEFWPNRTFEKTAAMIATRFSINAKINQKIKASPDYFVTWQKLCSYMFAYLLGPAKFLERNDADELVCLPIVTKIQIGKSIQSVRAINVYNSTKWIGTLFFRDPEFNNEFAFYGQNGFISVGSWVSKIRGDVQSYNLYGLTKPTVQTTQTKSSIIESIDAVGNTITVRDIFSKIEKLKETYIGNN